MIGMDPTLGGLLTISASPTDGGLRTLPHSSSDDTPPGASPCCLMAQRGEGFWFWSGPPNPGSADSNTALRTEDPSGREISASVPFPASLLLGKIGSPVCSKMGATSCGVSSADPLRARADNRRSGSDHPSWRDDGFFAEPANRGQFFKKSVLYITA